MSDRKKGHTVGVFLGGNSSERAISIKSGRAIYQALKSSGVRVQKIDPKKALKETLRKRRVQTAFLALHGKGGEDGTIQRELEKLKISYTGSSAHASKNAFNKFSAKRRFDRARITTPEWTVVTRQNFKRKLKDFPFPVFSKPLADGSSIGVNFLRDFDELLKREAELFTKEDRLLIEKRIEGKELTVGILGSKALPVIELKPKRAFYDYRAKYTSGQTRYCVPAPIKPALADRAQYLALKTHRALGLRDFSRVDMMCDKKGKLHVLEANTIPGFTELSLFPKAAQAVGISFEELCLKLLSYAEGRKKRAERN